MKNLDKGTVTRTSLLLLALINQALIIFGVTAVPVTEDQVVSLIDGLYLVGSMIFTIVTSVIAWFKNNDITQKAKERTEFLKENGKL